MVRYTHPHTPPVTLTLHTRPLLLAQPVASLTQTPLCCPAWRRLRDVAEKPFATITYTEAIDLLMKSGKKFEYPVSWGLDMQSEHER
jgi:aspartyl/asparaginyl-tRNA synthetase